MDALMDYNRKIIYLQFTCNNRADTTLQLFMKGIQDNGLPSRVRGVRGGEKVGVARVILKEELVEVALNLAGALTTSV